MKIQKLTFVMYMVVKLLSIFNVKKRMRINMSLKQYTSKSYTKTNFKFNP